MSTRMIALISGIGLVAGCGGSDDEEEEECTAQSAESTTSVTIGDNFFEPECVKVAVGTEVTFTNEGQRTHTVSTDAGQAESFDSGDVGAGETFQHTFKTAGTIAIHCNHHSNMYTTVIVQ